MTKPSILFIEPSGNTNLFDNYMRLPLLGGLYLATILSNKGYDIRILNENILRRKLDPFELRADIFCITALTPTANRAKFLAGQLKKLYPNSKIIMGGIHATLLVEEFIDVADHIVLGEAEGVILDVIENKYSEKIIHGSKVEDVNSLPLVNYSLLEGYECMDILPVMTSRGCPFDCNFCTVTKIFGKEFRMQSPERIVSEIENALSYVKCRDFFFYDDNFTANKKRVNEFCDLLLKRKVEINWFAQVRSDLAKDPELVKKMVDSGLRWVYIGFESISDATLKAFHKSQTRADIERAIEVLHSFGVNIHGMFMFGEDNDTLQSFNDTVDFAVKNEIDTVQFMILTPFPGTQTYIAMESDKRLFHKNWDYYNAMFAVFKPKNMSPTELMNETYKAYSRFYSLRRTLFDTLFVLYNILLDALVWNFKRTKMYTLDIMLLRAGAQILIRKYSVIYDSYLKYFFNAEKN
jgi:anaerobic magnesium-protoporphyrin IX monomethyl ester cyclase